MGIVKRIVAKALKNRQVAWVVLWFLARHIDLPLWLHVGAAKTGTKTLQWDIFPHHPQVWYFGIGGWGQSPLCRYNLIELILAHACKCVTTEHFSPNEPIRAVSFAAMSSAGFSGLARPNIYLISNEALCLVGPPRYTGYGPVTLPKAMRAKTKVLYVIRSEVSHLHSLWLELLSKRFNRACTLLAHHAADEFARISSADAPLESYEGAQALFSARINVCKPRSFVEETLPAMGKEIHVLPYELFVEEPKAYLNKISNLMGIDPEVTWKLYDNASDVRHVPSSKAKVDAPGKRNMAMRQRGVEFHQHFKHRISTYDADPKFFFKTAEEYAATLPTKPRQAFTDTLREIKNNPSSSRGEDIRKLIGEPRFNAWMTSGEEAKMEFSAETLARLREIRAPQNRWLAEKFNLDLKRYGYAM